MTEGADSKVRSLLSLHQVEYDSLLEVFSPLVKKKLLRYTLKNKLRKRVLYQELSTSSLCGPARKLEFILSYLKENPNQTYHGYTFGLSQSKTSEWISFLIPVLEEALERQGVMPQTGTTYQYQEQETDYLLMDVTERAIPRRSDYEAQREEYSGKKKYHTMKNLAITDARGYVFYLSPSYEGTLHDKALWNDLEIGPMELNLLVDLGFLGIEHSHPNAIMPFKRSKNKPLTTTKKQINAAIASLRVVIEHTFSGIKILKIIREKIRLKSYDKRDQVMRIATALHNLRMTFRKHLQPQS